LHVIRGTKQISTLLLFLLLLCSAIVGGMVSYLMVMSSYYNMPENSTMLIVGTPHFSVANFSYFNLTVLNPSNSASDMNITAFRLIVIGTNETYDVNTTEYPVSLPYLLQRGVNQTFKCIYNWSNITGTTVRIEPLPVNVSSTSDSYTLPSAELHITPIFDVAQSVNYFNLSIENPAGSANLTISEIDSFSESLSVTPLLPYPLQNNQSEMFTCHRNWDDLRYENVTTTVKTAEGYEQSLTTNVLPGADLRISNVKFDYADTTYFNLTIASSESSTADPILKMVNVTLGNESSSLYTIPLLNITEIPVTRNQSLTIMCFWNWNLNRNEDITINAYTKQNFTVPAITVTTPPATVWNVTDVKFDLDDPTRFWVNVTNTPCSTNSITVAKIQLNGTDTTLDHPSAVLINGTQVMFTCTMNWTNFIGQNANVTVFTAEGANISTIVVIPYAQLKLLGDTPVYGDLQGTNINTTTPYINVTVSNSANSLWNVTISRIVLEAGNITHDLAQDILYPQVASGIYVVNANETVTFVCYSKYAQYLASNTIEITVYTVEGPQVSRTWHR
jgi:hypothetical protein